MGYLDVHLLAVFAGDISVIVLHTRQEESDYLTGVVMTFLNDAQLIIAAALSPSNQGNAEDDENWLPETPTLNPNQTNMV